MPDSHALPEEMPDPETICAHWGEDPTRYFGAATPPIFQNSLFTSPDCETREQVWGKVASAGRPGDDALSFAYDYTRVSNPTTDITEAKIAALEGGEKARCFGSGMAAISAAILSCVKTGDHVIALETSYGPTRQFLIDYLARFGVTHTLVDGSCVQEFADAIRPNTTMIYLESPSSIVFKQQDLTAIAALAKAHGIATICDNSWASPYFQNPLKMGVDLVVHSATKYLGGHSDVVAGVVVGSEARMRKLINDEGMLLGGILDPFASWLLLRGLRTLPVRMERHCATATRIANALLDHPKVTAVYYPGLRTDPQRELTCRQLRGTGGLMSVELKAQSKAESYRFVNALKYFGIGCSWGGFESLALPMTMEPRILGYSDTKTRWIIRMYFGLESADDLWDDIRNALATV